jgi:capsular polysaccharide biosynthesis protein
MEETISLKELFHILKKRLAIILVIAFGTAIALLNVFLRYEITLLD